MLAQWVEVLATKLQQSVFNPWNPHKKLTLLYPSEGEVGDRGTSWKLV